MNTLIDEYVDGAVAVCEPHHGELDGGRRLERTDETLNHKYHDVRRPEDEECDAGEGQDLDRSEAAGRAGSRRGGRTAGG